MHCGLMQIKKTIMEIIGFLSLNISALLLKNLYLSVYCVTNAIVS